MKCSGRISAKGGVSNGVCHGCRSGLAAAVWVVSDIAIPAFRLWSHAGSRLIFDAFSSREPVPTSLENALKDDPIYITRYGIFRPFTLDRWALFREIAPPEQDLIHEPT